MAKHNFLVVQPRESWPTEGLPAFVLEQDNFNDYGFRTLYRLSYVTRDQNGKVSEDLIGPVKILRIGQTRDDELLIKTPFTLLGEDFCSVGSSLDYYERLRKLRSDLQRQVIVGLRDIVGNDYIDEQRFRKEEGWSTSLFRDDKDDSYLKLARGLLTGNYSHLPKDDLQLGFDIPGWQKPIILDFSNRSSSGLTIPIHRRLPDRITVLIGRNGSGKSTVLARLARVALGTTDDRDKEPLRSLGQLTPPGIGFPRVITLTFSAFDSFRLPGSDNRDRQKVITEVEAREGRFVFIGLRDIAAEVFEEVDTNVGVGTDGAPTAALSNPDRLVTTRLKSVDQLAQEFLGYLEKITTRGRMQELNDAFEAVLEDSPFSPFLVKGMQKFSSEEIGEAFLLCSTGHKIAALVVVGLIATLESSSLVLFDEPEAHLHPPLLAALMHTLRWILRSHDSYCIVATHSPVVVQETMARHVRVVRRAGSVSSAAPPDAETFGENIGSITSEVFGLTSETTDYHQVLDRLLKEKPKPKLESIEELFLNGQMSHQARAYVMSQLLKSDTGEN